MQVEWRRGFIFSVRCTLDAWRRHGPAVVKAHPVQTVSITDREPFHFRAAIPEQWGWRHSQRRHEVEVTDEPLLDRPWWDALAPEPPEGSAWKLYDSEAAAREDFGRVLLAWAKAAPEPQTKVDALLAVAKELASTFDALPS
jgi:hypothetical protein